MEQALWVKRISDTALASSQANNAVASLKGAFVSQFSSLKGQFSASDLHSKQNTLLFDSAIGYIRSHEMQFLISE